jgi:predicted transcriptional regulator
MSEARLLFLVFRYPHRTALARRVRDGSVFAALRRLEALGLVWRQRDQYRLTKDGKAELEVNNALTRLLAASHQTSR